MRNISFDASFGAGPRVLLAFMESPPTQLPESGDRLDVAAFTAKGKASAYPSGRVRRTRRH
jgi:hypothetical protein